MKIILLTILFGVLATSFAVKHRHNQNPLTSYQHDKRVDPSIQALLQTTKEYTDSEVIDTLREIKSSYENSRSKFQLDLEAQINKYNFSAQEIKNEIASLQEKSSNANLLIKSTENNVNILQAAINASNKTIATTLDAINDEKLRRSQAQDAHAARIGRLDESLSLTDDVLGLMKEIQDNENESTGGQTLLEKNREQIQTKLDNIEGRLSKNSNSSSIATTIKGLLEVTQSTQNIAELIVRITELVGALRDALLIEKNTAREDDEGDAEKSKKILNNLQNINETQQNSISNNMLALKEDNEKINSLIEKISSYDTERKQAESKLEQLIQDHKGEVAPIEGEIKKLTRYIYSLDQALACLGVPVDETDEEEEPEEEPEEEEPEEEEPEEEEPAEEEEPEEEEPEEEEPEEEEPEEEEPEEEEPVPGLPNLRIAVDFEHFTGGSDFVKTYVTTELVPAVVSYFQGALKAKYPLTEPIRNKTESCTVGKGVTLTMPKVLAQGVEDADVFIFFNSMPGDTAATFHCEYPYKRPYIVSIGLSLTEFKGATVDENPVTHDRYITILAHEFFHALGLAGATFGNGFLDKNGNTIKNFSKKYTLEDKVLTVWDFEPLTTRLRNHYNCSSLPGIFLTTSGAAHWHFRYYTFDVMAGSNMVDVKISEISLAFLESTGWFEVDYSYADAYYFGKNAGCDFFDKPLDALTYDQEYCTTIGQTGCSAMGSSYGSCGNNWGSRMHFPFAYYHCHNPNRTTYSPIKNIEVSGRMEGSMCFEGNLNAKVTSQYAYCLTYDCVTEGASTTLYVILGSERVPCTAKGNVTVPGYTNHLFCPDPAEFCSTIGKPSCLRNCMGRGTCVQGKCHCNPGFQGLDCGFTAPL